MLDGLGYECRVWVRFQVSDSSNSHISRPGCGKIFILLDVFVLVSRINGVYYVG